MHKIVAADVERLSIVLTLPPKQSSMSLFSKKGELEEKGIAFAIYLSMLLECNGDIRNASRLLIAQFLDTKNLISPPSNRLTHSETIPNGFVILKAQFMCKLVDANGSSLSSSPSTTILASDPPEVSIALTMLPSEDKKERMMIDARKTWGVEWVVKIFEAYALLQRMATLLSWTLEINHFFVSMFGNTLAFSKLPLRDVLMTLREIIRNFLKIATELYDHSCVLNSEQKYKVCVYINFFSLFFLFFFCV